MLRGLGPAETRANLDAILAELKRRGIPAMLTGMMAPRNMGPDYAARIQRDLSRPGEEVWRPLYPFFLDGVIGQPALLLEDGLHPSARGVEVMAQRLGPVVAEALGDPSR